MSAPESRRRFLGRILGRPAAAIPAMPGTQLRAEPAAPAAAATPAGVRYANVLPRSVPSVRWAPPAPSPTR